MIIQGLLIKTLSNHSELIYDGSNNNNNNNKIVYFMTLVNYAKEIFV